MERDVLTTLLYYDIWRHPLTARELFAFHPTNSITFEEFKKQLDTIARGSAIQTDGTYYFVRRGSDAAGAIRKKRERSAAALWRMARISTAIIKRFPFVRGVFVSGDLSKNSADENSDIDFVILTAPGRLWICRACLIIFKKVFLLNRKKYFCLNYFLSTDNLLQENRNFFIATELAHLKPLHNHRLYLEILAANSWMRDLFPNFDPSLMFSTRSNDRDSSLRAMVEWMFNLLPADRIDDFLHRTIKRIWARRYPHVDPVTRERIFRSTKRESRTFVGDFQQKILAGYRMKLAEFGVERAR
jgi:hypothetical protein